jgi:protocatechuate 3,4-dioxygenase beta subunit
MSLGVGEGLVVEHHKVAKAAVHLLLLFLGICGISSAFGATCTPTPSDALGPFYKPNAPVRSSVGKGYLLSGTVRSARDCSPIEGASVEFWLAGYDGQYDDRYRATIVSTASGTYRFESHFPPPYYGRPPHIHIRVVAAGYRTLVTQHYLAEGKAEATLDLVLVPER